ncbi:Crp/Fnr family transcriptional regulator [Bacteroides stercorirosoris]|uniref:Crp/Fnr family transcriptional regulator n=1 Tax=Bacteroides stercorirosoris TaxID=871324 RepID=A0A413H1L3_9BACE|nr:Crp/Fnr family transcriptional regulator [Bacteroides stercorirosoris]RGX77322.1 Crp/Fnr family transcriptional regulator [Bacteroides stercorirosoris]
MEAYLKKLCSENQVTEQEMKKLLARMKMIHLDKGTMLAPEAADESGLYIIASGILHAFTSCEGADKTIEFLSAGDTLFCYHTDECSVKSLTKSMVYYIGGEEVEELCAASTSFANLIRQLTEHQLHFREEMYVNAHKQTVKERYLSLFTHIPDILHRVPLEYITSYLGTEVTSLGYVAGRY